MQTKSIQLEFGLSCNFKMYVTMVTCDSSFLRFLKSLSSNFQQNTSNFHLNCKYCFAALPPGFRVLLFSPKPCVPPEKSYV